MERLPSFTQAGISVIIVGLFSMTCRGICTLFLRVKSSARDYITSKVIRFMTSVNASKAAEIKPPQFVMRDDSDEESGFNIRNFLKKKRKRKRGIKNAHNVPYIFKEFMEQQRHIPHEIFYPKPTEVGVDVHSPPPSTLIISDCDEPSTSDMKNPW